MHENLLQAIFISLTAFNQTLVEPKISISIDIRRIFPVQMLQAVLQLSHMAVQRVHQRNAECIFIGRPNGEAQIAHHLIDHHGPIHRAPLGGIERHASGGRQHTISWWRKHGLRYESTPPQHIQRRNISVHANIHANNATVDVRCAVVVGGTQKFRVDAIQLANAVTSPVEDARLKCGRPAGQRQKRMVHGLFNGVNKKNVYKLRQWIEKTDEEEEHDGQQVIPQRIVRHGPDSRRAHHEHVRPEAARYVFFRQSGGIEATDKAFKSVHSHYSYICT